VPETVLGRLGPNVYVTLDVDVMDPSIMPATGTPEPGGFLWDEMDALLGWLGGNRRIVGFDIVELMPIPGFVAPDFLVSRLTYRLLGRVLSRPDELAARRSRRAMSAR
jgi:agmatinase